MKAVRLLSENIAALLRARHLSQHDLAQWCHHSDPWLSSFLAGKREIQLKDLDRIADFFGIATYQLFQPGIGDLTERRATANRRSGRERRQSQAQRVMLGVASAVESFRVPRGKVPHAEPSSFVTELRRLTEDHERKVSALIARAESGGQTPSSGRRVAQASKGRRAVRGPDPDAS